MRLMWLGRRCPTRRAGATYDAAPGSTPASGDPPSELPILEVSPVEVVLADVNPDGTAVFAVDIVQVGGSPYDAAIHDLEIGWGSPWDKSELRYDAGGSVGLPLTLRFEMDLSMSGFTPDTEYVGEFSVNAVRRA